MLISGLVSDGGVYVVSENHKVFRIVNRTIDPKFESFELQKDLQNSDAIFFDYSSLGLVAFKGETDCFWTGL